MTKKQARSTKPSLKAAGRSAQVQKGSTRSSVPARKGMVRKQQALENLVSLIVEAVVEGIRGNGN
jgi:hypothetical protein